MPKKSPLSVGVGPYQLEEVIGAGGMGKVYRAYDRRLDRRVAVKQIRPDKDDDPIARRRLRREARAVAALAHPAIVQVFDLVESEGSDWIVMELVDGPTLARRIEDGPLGVAEVVGLARDLAEGLAYAHAQGFLHRDLKAENVMISQLGRAKILDFGLAKQVVKDETESSLTLQGSVLGTFHSMSPEQAKGYDIDGRSDLFSLGTLLYESLTARSPFRGQSSLDTLNRVCTHRQSSVHELREEVPRDLSNLVDRLLEKLPEHRPPSARHLGDELRAIARRLESAAPLPSRVLSPSLVRETAVYPPKAESGSVSATPRRGWRRPLRTLGAAAAWLALGSAVVLWVRSPPVDPSPPGVEGARTVSADLGVGIDEPRRIVVLPFENLGPQDHAYFASGITEEISRRLALISGLGVISRTSAVRYAGAGVAVRQIGRELDVEFVLEGSVNWPPAESGSGRIRITPRLVRVADDTQVWTDAFDRRPDDVLQVQAEIAAAVVSRLDVTLQAAERNVLEARVTEVPAAYSAYLRGLEYRNRPQQTDRAWRTAARLFQLATEKDPTFTQSYVDLSLIHALLYFNNDRSEKRRRQAEAALGSAQALAPDLLSVRLASAYHAYYVEGDYERALETFSAAAARLPHNAEILAGLGRVHRRQGELAPAVKLLAESFSLDRANPQLAYVIAETYRAMRLYEEADAWFATALELAPDHNGALAQRAMNALVWKGCPSPSAEPARCSTEEARRMLRDSPIHDDPTLYRDRLHLDLYDATIVGSERARDFYASIVERLAARPPRPDRPGAGCFYFWREALAFERLGRHDAALERVSTCMEILEALLETRPRANDLLGLLGIAYAYLDRREAALAAVERSVEESSRDFFVGPKRREHQAVALVLLGDHDRAVEKLEQLTGIHYRAPIDPVTLLLDPIWDPLRELPRFQNLLSRPAPGVGLGSQAPDGPGPSV